MSDETTKILKLLHDECSAYPCDAHCPFKSIEKLEVLAEVGYCPLTAIETLRQLSEDIDDE